MSDRQACALQIATIVYEWAHVEQTLTMMFSSAMGAHQFDADGTVHTFRDWTALAVMSTLDSLHARIQVVRAALIPRLTKNLLDDWERLERDIRGRARDRNLVAHSPWTISDEFPEDLLHSDQQGRVFRYSEQDFRDIMERIVATKKNTIAFMVQLLECVRTGTVQLPVR